MILIEDLGHVLPTPRSGKIVGIVHNKGEWLVACEYGLFRVWDDGVELKAFKTYPGELQVAAWLEEMHDYANPEDQRTLQRAADLLRAGAVIPVGGCGCRENGVPIMKAQCPLHKGTKG